MPDLLSAFGEDAFGRRAEAAALLRHTPIHILGQTALVIAWIAINAIAVGLRWGPNDTEVHLETLAGRRLAPA
jgi:uncharacterized membrane protein